MGFLSKLGSKSFNNNNSYKLSNFFEFIQQKGWYNVSASAALTLYNKNSALADAVDTIAGECKNIEPFVYQDGELVEDHEVCKFLQKPNCLNNWNSFMESLAIYKLLTRNAFIVAIGSSKYMPNEMWVEPTTAIYANGTGLNFKITTNNTNALIFLDGTYPFDKATGRFIAGNNLKELIKISGFINPNTTDGYVADSILSSILYELEILNHGNNHNLSLLLNGVNLSGVFNIDTMDTQAVDQFKIDVANYFGGSRNAGKYLVSKGKAIEFRPIQMTNKDMQQIENVDNARKVIFDRYQIPSPMRENDAQTYDNYTSAQYVFYDRTILPFVNSIFEELTQFFRKRKVLKDNQYISYNPSEITALQKRFAEELKFKKEIGVLTINELRELQGYDGIGAEGDVLYQPIGNVPVGFMNSFNSLENGEKKIRTILEKKGIEKDKIEALVGKFYANSK